MNKTLIRILFLVLILVFFSVRSIDPSQVKSEECPLRRVSLYDLEVNVPLPGPGSMLSTKDWWGLFLVSKGVRERLLDEDPDKKFVDFSDFQLAGHLGAEDEEDFPQGPPSNLAPPGAIYDTDYIVTGSVYQINPLQVKVSLQAAVTRELVGDVIVPVDIQNPYDSGKQAAEGLSPVGEKIQNFQRNKRNENPIYAVYPNMSIIPLKYRIKTQDSTKVTIRLNDCDGVALRNRSVRLSSSLGQFEPQAVTTDEEGEAESTFTAGKTPGYAQLTTNYEWKYPCGHGPFLLSEGTSVAIDQRPVDLWTITATVTQNVTIRAKKMHKLAEVTIPSDHPLIKSGTYRIRKQNMLRSTLNGRASLHMVVRVDTSSGDFVYSGEDPLSFMVSGNVSKRDKEEKIEFISKDVSEFSTKRRDTYTGIFDEGSFEFQYTPDYQYVSVFASSKGQVQTEHERYEDGKWRSKPYTLLHTLGIGAGWSMGEEGGSITPTKSGYSFSYRKTETERKETSDFGTISTVTTITMNGRITPFSKR